MIWKPVLHDDKEMVGRTIQGHPLFKGLAPAQLMMLNPALQVKEFHDEDIVCHCPDSLHDAFILLEGAASVTHKKDDTLYFSQIEEKGALFNIGPLVGVKKDPAGVRALGDTKVLAIDNKRLLELLDADPEMGYRLTRNLCRLSISQCERQIEYYLD